MYIYIYTILVYEIYIQHIHRTTFIIDLSTCFKHPLDLKPTSFQLSAARSRCASPRTPCDHGLPGPVQTSWAPGSKISPPWGFYLGVGLLNLWDSFG